jgi:hypothetical protein
MLTQRLYAFWKYDQFPFVLGGEVTAMQSDGSVETVGYGKGYWFTPFKIVPLADGRKIAKELERLRAEYRQAQATLAKEFVDKRNQVITIPST